MLAFFEEIAMIIAAIPPRIGIMNRNRRRILLNTPTDFISWAQTELLHASLYN